MLRLRLKCSHIIQHMRQSMPCSKTCQLSSLSLHSSSYQLDIITLHGLVPVHPGLASPSSLWGPPQYLVGKPLGGSHITLPSQFIYHLHVTLATGGCFDYSQTLSLVAKSFHLMLKIFLMHFVLKTSSFFSWLVFRCRVSTG